MTSENWGFGVFLVWFCHLGTTALYWGFFFFDKHSIGFGLFCFCSVQTVSVYQDLVFSTFSASDLTMGMVGKFDF